MAQRALTVESEEAASRAADLAARLGKSTTEIVIEALRAYEQAIPASGSADLTPEQEREHRDFVAFVRSLKPFILPGATSDHRDLFDERGLPRA